MKNFHSLAKLLEDSESELMAAILNYALTYGYSQYTSTLVESWRLSISGLTNAISRYIVSNPEKGPEIAVDSNYRDDAIAGFGVIEAQRHRSRGVDLGMFLGLFKYYRDSYIDIVKKKEKDKKKAEQYARYLIRCFDRIELAFCIEWATASEDFKLDELQSKNIVLANEKNKYLTLFESFWSPIVLLGSDDELDNINMAGIQLLEHSGSTGFLYYNDEFSLKLLDEKSKNILHYKNRPILEIFPWLESSLSAFSRYNANYNQFVTNIFNASTGRDEDYCVTMFSMRDLSKRNPGKIIFFENVTEKIHVDKKLRESEEKYRTLVETMNEGILVLNEDHVVTYINEKLCALLGLPKEEILGHSFEEFLLSESKPDFMKQQSLRKEGCSDSYEFGLVNKDGEKVFVLSSPTPITGPDLSYRGSYEVLTNISNIKLIEMQLIHSQKMETIGIMAAGLAHEINTPLQYVIGNSSFIKETIDKIVDMLRAIRETLKNASPAKSSDEALAIGQIIDNFDMDFVTQEIPPAINACLEGLSRISSIVSSVKKFAHPDSGKYTAIDVNEEIGNAIRISRNEWKHVAELSSRFDETLPQLLCVASDFNQVVLNLIINAAHAIHEKYTRTSQKGLIHVTTSSERHSVLISISDTGSGIPDALRDKIFNPFFTTKEVGKGTGMGLAIVLKIIEKHKGKIWFESKEGEGTTFYVQFPLG